VTRLTDLARAEGRPAYDASGNVIGRVEQIYLSDTGNHPRWLTLREDAGTPEQVLVPADGATLEEEGLRLPWTREQITTSPRLSLDQHLGPAEEARLYEHYGIEPTSVGRHAAQGEGGVLDGDEASLTLSEERVVADTEEVTRRVRLRRYVTTEVQTIEVPLKRERLAIERVTDETATPEVIEDITLREERVVSVQTETFAVEDVQIGKEVVTEERRLTVEVAREHLDIDADPGVVRGPDEGSA